MCLLVCVCARVCVRACVRACERAGVRACVRGTIKMRKVFTRDIVEAETREENTTVNEDRVVRPRDGNSSSKYMKSEQLFTWQIGRGS